MGNTAKQCRLGLFQDSGFAGDLEDSKSTSGGTLCIFGSHTFVPMSWMCKKQTSVSHSSTESEIISLGAGLRLDGKPALYFMGSEENRKHKTDWELLMKDVDLGEPTSFFDHAYLGCTQSECKMSANCRDMFESRISAGAKEKLPVRASRKPDAEIISSWSYDMEDHAKKCVERYCELANKTIQQFYKVAPCMDDHQFKEEEIASVGELSTVCSQIALK